MTKKIKSKEVQMISSKKIPYKNVWGNWVWRDPDMKEYPTWPGIKSPSWVEGVIFQDDCWCWTDFIKEI